MNSNKKFSKIISVVIILSILLTNITAFAAEREITASGTYQKASWTLYSDGELVISGKEKTGNDWRKVISNEDVTKVTIGEGITSITGNAFNGYKNMTDITLPSSLETIHNTVFNGCTALENVYYTGDITDWCLLGFGTNEQNPLEYAENLYINNAVITDLVIPEGVTVIALNAFRGYKKLSSVTFPNSMLTIGESAFRDCTSLSRAYFSESIATIGDSAFYGCTELNEITLPENIEHIGAAAFKNTAYYNDAANWDSGFLYIGSNLINANAQKVSSACKLFSKTRLIASNAFYNCTSIESIAMPDSVEYINDSAFYGCSNMKLSNLPANLKAIDSGAFRYCALLGANKVEIPSSVIRIGDNAFYGCNLKSIIINDGLQVVGSNAFANNYELTEINIPRTVETLDNNSFSSSSITDIYYGDTKAEWKRLASEVKVENITVHYTLRNTDDSVLIQHTDKNFIWEAGNVHLEVSEITPASPAYDRNGYYNKNMISPIKVLDIRIVDGDGNSIQPLSEENITVKIKAPDEFVNMVSTLLNIEDEVDFKTVGFSDCVFSYEKDGGTIAISLPEEKLNKLKIVHWFSDGTEPGDYEVFTYDRMKIYDGYIILETNHFSEYAVCTDMLEIEQTELEIENGKTAQLNVTVGEGENVTYTSSDENVAKVDSNGVVTAVGPGTATIIATVDGTGVSAKCTVNVPFRKFTVKWVVEGVVTEQEITEQSPLIAPTEAPEKAGYIFKGWSPAVPDTMPAKNLTFTAVFEAAPVADIEIITTPTKTAYTYKTGNIDLSGIELKVTYEDGYSETVTDTSKMTVSGFDSKKVGNQTVTVEYAGATAEFQVGVSYAWWQWIIRIILLGIFWY
ncbi:MAG: leucine-rich repeat protein [Clostridia bacterium]|nr:leucine-rich repeat protein [Clostridia bacterium]